MGIYDGKGGGVTPEQLALLKSRNFSIRPLSTAGHLDAWKVFTLTWQPILIFVITTVLLTSTKLRYSSEVLVKILYYSELTVLMLVPLVGAVLLVIGILASGARAPTRIRGSAVLFWSWWPFWRFVLCIGAALAGTWIGNELWASNFYPHSRMQRLQVYTDVDPAVASGKRLQDAGVIQFNASTGVNRAQPGCFRNGAVYCVAPILPSAQASAGLLASRPQDLFMAGLNCCSCPGEFRCGDWNVPGATGGLRVLNTERHNMFTLAAQEWAAATGRELHHPLFFEWVSDPVAAYNNLYDRGMRIKTLALVCFPIVVILTVMLLNAILFVHSARHRGADRGSTTTGPRPGIGLALAGAGRLAGSGRLRLHAEV